MNKKELLKKIRDFHRRDKNIDDWVDKAVEQGDKYTQDLYYRLIGHVISRQNDIIKKDIERGK